MLKLVRKESLEKKVELEEEEIEEE